MTVHDMFHTESIEIAADPTTVYDTVRQLERMGEWSPEATGGSWTAGDGTSVGDEFHGDNAIGDRVWTVPCFVTVADPGVRYEFTTISAENPMARWTFDIEATDAGSRVTEIWDVDILPPTLADADPERLAGRKAMVADGMKATLAGLKATLESA